MNYKKLGIAVVCTIAVAAGALSYYRDSFLPSAHQAGDITDLSGNYEASEEIAAAENQLAAGIAPVEILTTLQDNSPRVAIVFDGLPDRPTTERIVDLLKKYNAQAVFFAEGENAADQPETIQKIVENGQEIGNFTYIGAAAMEQLSPPEQISQLCRTQKVLEVLTNSKPKLFRANRTVFTEPLLKSVHASGLSYAVKESVWYNRNVIHNQAQADAYVASIRPGSIIAIKVGTPVERVANEKGKTNERPAFDKKPTIAKDAAPKKAVQTEDLADEVERLLIAFQKRGIKLVFVDQFRKIRFVPTVVPAKKQPAVKPQAGAKAQPAKR